VQFEADSAVLDYEMTDSDIVLQIYGQTTEADGI
jgi:hypothetical protein